MHGVQPWAIFAGLMWIAFFTVTWIMQARTNAGSTQIDDIVARLLFRLTLH